MAMYYYASKISAIACGARCKASVLQKSRGQRDRDKYREDFVKLKDENDGLGSKCCHEVSTPTRSKSAECSHSRSTNDASSSSMKAYDPPEDPINYECSVLGSGGIMYINGRIVSGPLDSVMDILIPKSLVDLDKDFIFSFLLSSRLFIRPYDLLGKLVSSVPENASLENLVGLLGVWTEKFPYDFRDERIMNHVKHIVARCSQTDLEELVSKLLSALLTRLTDLEIHEKEMRACQANADKTDSIQSPTASQYAQILCRIERKLAKHVGPEEFLQCSANVLLDKQSKKWDQPSTSGGPPGIQDPKKTCNLETYLEWSARLRLFVCNEILQVECVRNRSKIVERWSGVAQYCLLVGNYNSATAILESLESPAIARLKITWSKLSTTCQQLDCMQRHAEGYGDLWSKQAIILNENNKTDTNVIPKPNNKPKPNDWVVIPVFADIVKLAVTTRDDCVTRLPNGHVNISAFDRLAAIVGAFTKHMHEVKPAPFDTPGEFEAFCRHMQKTSTLNENELMMTSFDCEEPNNAEKLMYDLN